MATAAQKAAMKAAAEDQAKAKTGANAQPPDAEPQNGQTSGKEEGSDDATDQEEFQGQDSTVQPSMGSLSTAPQISEEDLALLSALKSQGGLKGLVQTIKDELTSEYDQKLERMQVEHNEQLSAFGQGISEMEARMNAQARRFAEKVNSQEVAPEDQPETVPVDCGHDIYMGSDGKRYGPGVVEVPNVYGFEVLKPSESVATLLVKRIRQVGRLKEVQDRIRANETREQERSFREAMRRRQQTEEEEDEE